MAKADQKAVTGLRATAYSETSWSADNGRKKNPATTEDKKVEAFIAKLEH